MKFDLVVTRHTGLVDYLRQTGVITGSVPVIEHVTADDVRGKNVVGVLPLSLAALAASVTEVPLALTLADRGVELSAERVREIALTPRTYIVRLAEQFQ